VNSFHAAYTAWLKNCLREYNERFGESRKYYETPDHDYDPGDLVEFSEAGDAYPHGIGGTAHIRDAVTPWEASSHPEL